MKPDAKVISEAVERVERRRRRRKLALVTILIAALIVAFSLIRCRGGFGLGGGDGTGLPGAGEGTGTARPATGTAPAVDAAVRCAVRVDATGVSLDGKPAGVADAVAACRAAGGADVVVTGDARQGTWDELRVALEGAGVQTFVKGAGAAPAIDAGV